MKIDHLWLMKQDSREREAIFGDVAELVPGMTKLQFARRIIAPVKWWALAGFVAIAIAELLDVGTVYITKIVVDTFTSASPETLNYMQALSLLLLFTGVGFLTSLFWRISGYFLSHYLPAFYQRSTQALFGYIGGHNPGYFFNHFAGALATKIRNVSDGFFEIFDSLQWTIVGMVVHMLSTFVLFFLIDPLLTLVTVIWMVVFFGVYRFLGPRKRRYSKQVAAMGSYRTGKLVDSVTNMLTVTLFARREREMARFEGVLYNELDAKRASWRFTDLMAFANSTITLVARLALMILVANLWFAREATTGDIVLVFALSSTMSTQLRHLGQLINRLYASLGSIDEGLETLLVPYGIPDAEHATPLVVTGGGIAFEDVTFAYPEREPVLANFSLQIAPGEKVGVVGRSGAGKTTLMSLLLRFYDVTSGVISIDGQPVQDVTQESLRGQVAMVPQEPLLFHRSILENIRYGREDATEEEVWEAAKRALAHDFILELPEGYATKVGERGVKLSGGQRQRIAIARAILKDAPILVLDEATASLDSESEVAISQALHNLVEKKTVLAIAHRLSTLREMTRILVMDGGKVVEDGSHEELLAKGGLYASLWETQAGGFLQEE